ncbi:hypothetical protein BIU82_03600 [Arthrobacter sp. SW1]|nr:hypothetical protein BIU82_03600 [Arthrobacter sp. SW1]
MLTARISYAADDSVRPLRCRPGKPREEDVEKLMVVPRTLVVGLLEEKEQDLREPHWERLMNFVSIIGGSFAMWASLLLAMASFVAGDPRMQDHVSLQEAGQIHGEAAWFVGGLAYFLVVFAGSVQIRAILFRHRTRQWIKVCKQALEIQELNAELYVPGAR